jgi:hypothetical protein
MKKSELRQIIREEINVVRNSWIKYAQENIPVYKK